MIRGFQERLSNLLAVTDVSLTKLDVDDLLVEILERVRTVLDADTAAVLLCQSDYLIARAACGLEEEVRQGVRVPIGSGFAGRIAAERRPVVLDQVDSSTVANPILWEKGIRRMVGVPLLSGDELLGVLHVGRLQSRPFDRHDAELLQVAGERVASAIKTRRLAVEFAAAATLERELLPDRLPELAGLEFAARYAPAEDRTIGGDWYDAFTLPSGELWVVIGDVAGHGLHSAVIVNRVKTALQSYSLLGRPVSETVELTNRKLLHFELDTMVTMLCAVAPPPYDRFTVVSAGHPPPVLATGEATQFVAIDPGPPLGTIRDATFPSTEIELPADSTMVLYTDGLVERRGEPIDAGLERLRVAVTNDPPEQVCRDVMRRLVGGAPTRDDVAVVAVRRVGLDCSADLVLPATGHSVADARAFAERSLADIDPTVRLVVVLLVSEMATNCVMHAGTDFTVRISQTSTHVHVECADSGGGTVALGHPDPTATHGRGVSFIARLSDRWGVRSTPGVPGKTVWFSVRLDRVPPALEADLAMASDDASPTDAAGPDGPVLTLSGEVDLRNGETIVAQGTDLARRADRGQWLTVDVAQVEFLDSSGLSALLRLRRNAVEHGVGVRLRAVPDHVAMVLKLSGLGAVLPLE